MSWLNGWRFSPTTGDGSRSWSAPYVVWPSTLGRSTRSVDAVGRHLADEIGGTHPASVRQLARSTGLSERQLLRRSTAAFGYGPARLARIRRLQRALHLARSSPRRLRLVDLANRAGYVDQQHLTHEVQAIMGTTPSRLLQVSDVRSVQDGARAERE